MTDDTATAATVDDYAWWRDALRGVFRPMTEADPRPGFYRWRLFAGGAWLPVAIFRDTDGVLRCYTGHDYDETPAEVLGARWMACARHPVTEEAYRHAVEHNGAWPGMIEPLAEVAGAASDGAGAQSAPEAPASDGAGAQSAPEALAEAGHNAPPADVDPLPAEIEEAIARARAFIADRRIVSDADAAGCELHVNRLRTLAKAAEARRDEEVRPHLDAQRAVNARWKPIAAEIDGATRTIRAALAPYLAEREAERRAAAAAAIAKGTDAGARIETRAATPGTTGGRRLSLRTITTAEVQDWQAVALFFHDHPDVRAVLQKLVDKLCKVGAEIPRATVTARATALAAADTPVFSVRTTQVAQ